MDKQMFIELSQIIEDSDSINSDARAIKLAIERWKRVIDKYAAKADEDTKHFLGGMQRFLSCNEYDMDRTMFFVYMENLITLFKRVPKIDLNAYADVSTILK